MSATYDCFCLADARFKDLPDGTADLQRLADIGRDDLLMWWDKTRKVAHPATYGQTDHDFTSSVAYHLRNDLAPQTSTHYERRIAAALTKLGR
jgi:hypothetical protein